MIKACIFDLDGTLTNTLDSLEYSVNETMKEIGMPQALLRPKNLKNSPKRSEKKRRLILKKNCAGQKK